MYNLVTININGLNDRTKRVTFIHWVNCLKADIICLQETHASSHATLCTWFKGSGYTVASSSISNKRVGTAILVASRHQLNKVWRDDAGRFTQAEVFMGEERVRFTSLYAPNRNPDRNRFLASLPDFIDLEVPTFLCGDFNSVLDPDTDRRHPPSYQRQTPHLSAESVAALQSLLSATSTFPVWRTQHPVERAFSWDHGSGECSSRIDMIWAPLSLKDHVKDSGYYPSFFTDHRYLQVSFTLPSSMDRGPGYWKLNTSVLQDSEYCELVKCFWSYWQSQQDVEDFTTPLDWWDMGKFYLRELSRCFCKSKALSASVTKRNLTLRLRKLQRHMDDGLTTVFPELCELQEELRAHELRSAQAAQVRARCQWVEEGEVSSSYFFSLEGKHQHKKTMSGIKDPSSNIIHHDPLEILGVWRAYYDELFSAASCDTTVQDHLLSRLELTLSLEESEVCEGLLTLDECGRAVHGMSHGKTPGSDGFPMEFYVLFWEILGPDLVKVLNFAFSHGRLSTSQRRGIIILLYKKGDRLETKNWRPISLLNVDYKIATRVLAGRLLQVIGSVVSPDQTCGVPGRTISENIALLRDIIDYAESENLPVAFLALDQEKAFDRVDWHFLSRTLEAMGFGPSFRQWVSLFYTDVESAVLVNGWLSPFFNPSRGVRQGCPLSPLLYVLSVEVLACSLRASPRITGVLLPGSTHELRCSGYADDTTVIVTNDDSLSAVLDVYREYELGSGAKLNQSKSKGLWLGSWKHRTDSPLGLDWVKHLPILGAVLSASDYSRETWEPRVEKVEKRLASWKGRSLSYQGKALIVNAIALSQIWHLCAVFTMPGWVASRLDKVIWSFFWAGKRDLVAHRTMYSSKFAGGFGIVDFRTKADALRLQWFRRYLTDSSAKWKDTFRYMFFRAFTRDIAPLLAQRSFRKAHQIRLPPFHQQLLKAWRQFGGGLRDGQLVLGIRLDTPLVISTMTTQKTYRVGLSIRNKPPHCIEKFRPVYGGLHWSNTWQQLHQVRLDRVVIDLNWKVAHGVLYTASRLVNSFRYTNIDVMCFCRVDEESLEHLFFHCSFAQILVNWVYFQLLRVTPEATPFTVTEILFGFSKARRRCIPKVISWMLLVVKHRIWVARCDFRFRNVPPDEALCLKVAIARIHFLLRSHAAARCSSLSQQEHFIEEWLADGILGSFSNEKLVFSF